MSTEITKLYICNRCNPACMDKCIAKNVGIPIFDSTVCQYTSESEYSLSMQLGIPIMFTSDANNNQLYVERPDPYILVQNDQQWTIVPNSELPTALEGTNNA